MNSTRPTDFRFRLAFPPALNRVTFTAILLLMTAVLLIGSGFTAATRAQQLPLPNAPGEKAPPPNNNRANALAITFPYNGNTTNINEATIEAGEVTHPCRSGGASAGSHSVWFKFTVGVSGQFSADTSGSNFLDVNDDDDEDSVMTLWRDDGGTLTAVACNDDVGGAVDSYAVIAPTAVTPGSYLIQVSAFDTCATANCYLVAGSVLNLVANFVPDPTATHTPTASATLDPNITPTATNTVDPLITPSATFTESPTATPTLTATSTVSPTPLIAVAEMLVNGSFEFDNNNNDVPDDWESSGAGSATGSDKRKCNKDKDGDGVAEKIVALDGNCAYVFKSAPGENSKLTQDVDLTISAPAQANTGDSLTLSGFANAKGTVQAKVKVRVSYTDTTLAKGKINAKFSAPTDDYTAFTGTLTLVLAGEPQLIRVQVQNNGTSGKAIFDQLGLRLDNTVAP